MNTISTIGQTQAMDGYFNALDKQKQAPKVAAQIGNMPNSAAEVSANIESKIADTQAMAQDLQRLSDIVKGHKLRFNVNNELDKVVVTVIDRKKQKPTRRMKKNSRPQNRPHRKHSRLQRQHRKKLQKQKNSSRLQMKRHKKPRHSSRLQTKSRQKPRLNAPQLQKTSRKLYRTQLQKPQTQTL